MYGKLLKHRQSFRITLYIQFPLQRKCTCGTALGSLHEIWVRICQSSDVAASGRPLCAASNSTSGHSVLSSNTVKVVFRCGPVPSRTSSVCLKPRCVRYSTFLANSTTHTNYNFCIWLLQFLRCYSGVENCNSICCFTWRCNWIFHKRGSGRNSEVFCSYPTNTEQ